jgi:hypothetical protein
MSEGVTTRLALLGTISELHREPLPYDLARLAAIVAEIAPDLLCAEITLESWERANFQSAAVEVREALAPVVSATDVVLVPVAPSPERFDDFAPESGWRAGAAQTLDQLLRWGQRQSATPEAINSSFFGAFCHAVCSLSEQTWTASGRASWQAQNVAIAANIVEAVRRDPGRRVLAAVQCQRIHKLSPLLRRCDEHLEIVAFHQL